MHADVSADVVCRLLLASGFQATPDQLSIRAREDRWIVHLPDNLVAWFAASSEGHTRLGRERRVLDLLENKCSFVAPRVVFVSPDGSFDVRAMVPGHVNPWEAFDRVIDNAALASRIGSEIGTILADQHANIRADDIVGWLPSQPSWPLPSGQILEGVQRVTENMDLIAKIKDIVAMYNELQIRDADRVLTHSDLGFHNLAFELPSLSINGVFDYDGAAYADRHHDFRYLLFDRDRDDLLESAIHVYEPLVGQPISRDRVRLYNAICASSYLAHRAGAAPHERPCGRTLAEDLAWTAHATERVLVCQPTAR